MPILDLLSKPWLGVMAEAGDWNPPDCVGYRLSFVSSGECVFVDMVYSPWIGVPVKVRKMLWRSGESFQAGATTKALDAACQELQDFQVSTHPLSCQDPLGLREMAEAFEVEVERVAKGE